MSETIKPPGAASKHWSLIVFGIVLALIGLALLARGTALIRLGGSWYYAVTGFLLTVAGVLLVRKSMDAARIFTAVFIGTVVWALWEVGLEFWPLVPRLAPFLVLAFVFALVFPALSGGRARVQAWGLALVLLIVMGACAAWMFEPHGVVRNPVAQATLAPMPAGSDNWQYYGRTPRGTRFAPAQQIKRDNVSGLQVAWTFRTGEITEKGSAFQNTPIQIGDTLYLCTPLNKVFALNAETGEQRWMFDPNAESLPIWNRCRGVAYYEPDPQTPGDNTCAQRIILTTVDARLMELDAKTGQACTGFGHQGSVNLAVNMGEVKPGYYYL